MPEPPSTSEIIKRFQQAVDKLMQNDIDLLVRDVSERAITHKLGEYLQPLFPEWNVDCEYNRNGDRAKQISAMKKNGVSELQKIYPDVIVHERGTNDRNLLAIEAKKQRGTNANMLNVENEKNDTKKLVAYSTQDFGYKIGVFVTFYTGSNPIRKCQFKCYYEGDWHNEKGELLNQQFVN